MTEFELAKQLLANVRHAAMATVNEDGTPHNTPYFFMYSDDFSRLYWGSHQNSLHSINIARDGNIFVVLFDSFEQGKGGIYITADNAQEATGDEFTEALRAHNRFREKYEKLPLAAKYYQGPGQRMYIADVKKVEVYSATRDENSQIKQEVRKEIKREDLLS